MWRSLDPLTARHNQTALLIVTLVWVTYLLPVGTNITLPMPSIPTEVIPTWVWGAVLVTAASLVLAAERVMIKGDHQREPKAWWAAWVGHVAAAAVFATLAAAALVDGINQAHTMADIVGAFARPVLWGFIGHMHAAYARRYDPKPAT